MKRFSGPAASSPLSLRARLVAFALLCALPALLLAALQLHRDSEAARAEALQDSRIAMDRVQARLMLLLGNAEALGHALGASGRLPEPDDPGCHHALLRAREASPYVLNYSVADASGRLLCSVAAVKPGINVGELELFRQAMLQGRPLLSGYRVAPLSQQPALVLAVPLLGAGNQPGGVAFTVISARRLTEGLGASPTLAVTLLDANGLVVSRMPPHPGVQPGSSAAGTPVFQRIRGAEADPFEGEWMDGVSRLHSGRAILYRGEPVLWMATGVDRQALQGADWAAQLRLFALVLAVAAAVAALAVAATRPLVLARCRGLLQVAREVAGGRYDSRVELAVRDELTPVEAALNHMLQAIDDDRVQLQRSESRYRLLFENSLDGVLQTRPSGEILAANPAACRLLGRSETELRQLTRTGVVAPGETRLAPLLALRREQGFAQGELTLVRADGGRFEAEVASCMYLDAQGQPATWLVIRDITERKQAQQQAQRLNRELEDRVRQRTRELQAANRELEAFSYTVSHDLRTPVAVIESFSGLLQERAALPDEKDRHYLDRIRVAAHHMNELIEGLLALAHISRAPLDWEPVDLSELARDAAQECRDAEPERRVELQIEEGMVALGDRRLLRVALVNLIGNAWKFTRQQPDARIEVSMRMGEDGMPVYCVRDNGAGFDPAHAVRLFEAFNRLHRSAEFPGMGIGLATVARIVQRHGGRIWASARPQQGAAFHFVLGASPGAEPQPPRAAGETVF